MKLSLCNEVVRELDFAGQCALAAGLGYHGLELAPFTFGDDGYRMPASQRAEIKRIAGDAGLALTGLHWLLVAPAGLSITSNDSGVRERTLDVMRRLVELCADLGGAYLVHGSPAQRRVGEQPDPTAAAARGEGVWAAIAEDAAQAGVTYCIEPLAGPAADFVTTVAEAAAIVRRIGSPALRTMIDASAAGAGEDEPVAQLVRQWLPTGVIAHIHLNDRNRRGPGQGEDDFAPMLTALREASYDGWIGIEPFDYRPDGPTCAARSIGYIHGILEALK